MSARFAPAQGWPWLEGKQHRSNNPIRCGPLTSRARQSRFRCTRLVRACYPQELNDAIQTIVRSVQFEVLQDGRAFRLLGPDTAYHALDPFLPHILREFDGGLSLADVPRSTLIAISSSTPAFSRIPGAGSSRRATFAASGRDLVIVHLDDHTDMMSTLLECLPDGTSATLLRGRCSI